MRIRYFTILSCSLLFAACGGGDQAGDGAGSGAAAAPAVDPAVAATINGVVHFQGTAPANEVIDMSAEPTCAEKHSTPPTRSTVLANANGTLRNVFVYVKEGLPAQRYPAATEAPVLDQNGCEYVPHVLGVQAGQNFIVRNSDGLLHNVNARATVNRGFNFGQPVTMDGERSFAQQEVMVPVTCEVHGWMEAYIGVVDHPYFAVTGEDGSFTIPNLPPGTYTLEAWHERYGTQTAQVTVAAQQQGQADFHYDAAAPVAHVPLGAPVDLHSPLDHAQHATPAGGSAGAQH